MIHIDASSGLAGDMLCGALIDLGADPAPIIETLSPIADVSVKRTRKRGVPAVSFKVDFEPASRQYPELTAQIKGLGMGGKAQKTALSVLRVLGEAESHAHGVPLSKVHLHEAADCVVDSCAAALAMQDLGLLDEHFTSSIVSCGFVAPATRQIIGEYGIPVRFMSDKELLTPTGAALLAVIVGEYGDFDAEYGASGAGTMSLPWPNVCRLGRASHLVVLESNIDDCTPEHISHMSDSLMEAGALDVHVLPCMMKKGRIGFLVRVLSGDPQSHASIIMDETGSLGVRATHVSRRYEMPRKMSSHVVDFMGEKEKVRVKYSPTGYKAEFDDLSRLSRKHGVSFGRARELVQCQIGKNRA